MFIVRCPEQGAAEKAAEYHLGGYILFRENFEEKTPVQAAEMVRACQAAAALPMLVGVDEEGGTVNRISGYPAFRDTPFASPQELYQAGGFDAVREDALEKCAFLEELGVNVNFAPVCDVSTDPEDFIYKRSFGRNAAETAQYVRTVVETMGERGMGSVLKHFPGYGNNADTHTGIAVDDRPYDSFAASDFLPFRAGIEAGADIVLVSHNIVSCMDSAYPASLSPRVHEILREELGFTGVTVTDDLYMDGIRDFVDVEGAAVQAVLAGNDLLCCTDFEVQIPAVLAAVEQGVVPETRVDEAVRRILTLKQKLGAAGVRRMDAAMTAQKKKTRPVHPSKGKDGLRFCAALRVFRYGFGIFADIFEQKAVWMPLGMNIMEGIKRAFFGMPQNKRRTGYHAGTLGIFDSARIQKAC